MVLLRSLIKEYTMRKMHLFRDDLLTIKIVVCIYLICSCQRTGALPVSLERRRKNRCVSGMVGLTGLEPVTPALSRQCSNQLSYRPPRQNGGGKRVRTADPLLAKQVLYQLSYTPINRLLGLRMASPGGRDFPKKKG
jgi:hypothetical protein